MQNAIAKDLRCCGSEGGQTEGGGCRGCKMGIKAGIKPVFSEFLIRGDGRENIARRCASVRKGKI